MFSHRCCSCEEAEITGSALKVTNKKAREEGAAMELQISSCTRGRVWKKENKTCRQGGRGVLWFHLIMFFVKAGDET